MVAAEDPKHPPAGTRRSSRLADVLLIVASVVFSIAMAEGVVRYLNGQPVLDEGKHTGARSGRAIRHQ